MTQSEPVPETNAKPPISVDRAAHSIAFNLPVTISFSCYGCRFDAVARETPAGPVVSVNGVVGAIPFSAESTAARAMTKAVLARHPSSQIVRLELDERGLIAIRGEAPLGDTPSPAGAVAAASAVLSAAKPLMDILAQCGANIAAPTTDPNVADASSGLG